MPPVSRHEAAHETSARHFYSEDEVDAALGRAALAALGSREGTIIVMDAQTGRVRAAANERLAREGAFPPGSAVKPFTLLTALDEGVVSQESRLSCRKHYTREGVEFTCSHPVLNPPLGPRQALAYSCNYFFARLAERVRRDDLIATLSSFGFGTRPAQDTNSAAPAGGHLPRGRWRFDTALGEGAGLLVTPLQMIAAYAALANGGRLFAPQAAPADGFHARERARVEIDPAARALLLEGMRGAVKYGTAEGARLDELPLNVFGKTGTATQLEGFRTDGWFVGFAAEGDGAKPADEGAAVQAAGAGEDAGEHVAGVDEAEHAGVPPPSAVKLAVLVFLRREQGRECAGVARRVFAEYARMRTGGVSQSAEGAAPDAPWVKEAEGARRGGRVEAVRVHLARKEKTVEMPMDDYVFGVLAAEASTEDEFAALKAQAVVSRTYALANLRRHARDRYDFCTTTHCQRFLAVTPQNARPGFHDLLRGAVEETAGEVLRDERGRLLEAYFSASCGGTTANSETLWGVPARGPYARGVRDEYCGNTRHSRWADAIPARQLLQALRDDPRSDVGGRLDRVSVVRRDPTGRAQLVAVEGERRRTLRGWDFKIIVGRTLGWGVLKSSRFEVARAGDKFVFRGGGFGHGLGLCQAGAHVMARRGASYDQILAHYFPGAVVSRKGARESAASAARSNGAAAVSAHERQPAPRRHAREVSLHHPPRLTLASANFRVSYPAAGEASARREVDQALRTLEAARADLRRRLEAAALPWPALPVLEVYVYETTGDFTGATGEPAWAAAVTRGRRIETQPLTTLRRRSVLASVLRHEYAHAVVEALSRGRAPRWLKEGLAAHFAGEGPLLTRRVASSNLTTEEIERGLSAPSPTAAQMRALYAAAYRAVAALIRGQSEAAVWRRAANS